MAWEKEGAASMAWQHERRRRWCSAGVVREEEDRVGRKGEQASGWLGRLSQNLKKNSFQNKNWIFEWRFRRYFDMGIFPKFF
jgi:hypothetical protein